MFDSNEMYFGFNPEFDGVEDNPEFMPLFSKQDEEDYGKMENPEEVPVLTIRNTVLFPGVIFPITLGRDMSIKLVREAAKKDKIIAVVAQRNPEVEDPAQEDLYEVGTLAHIIRTMRMPDGTTTVIIQGRKRIHIDEYTQKEPYFKAKISNLVDLPVTENG